MSNRKSWCARWIVLAALAVLCPMGASVADAVDVSDDAAIIQSIQGVVAPTAIQRCPITLGGQALPSCDGACRWWRPCSKLCGLPDGDCITCGEYGLCDPSNTGAAGADELVEAALEGIS